MADENGTGRAVSTLERDDPTQPWTPWVVAPRSGFEVENESGLVGLVQTDDENFFVTSTFRFNGKRLKTSLVAELVRDGVSDSEAVSRVDAACRFEHKASPTNGDAVDLASIPRFLRWFESSYGRHTLAAIIHDRLIQSGQPNAGDLASDILADRFFRDMLGQSGVPWLKRWIMWTAVALRTRWAAGATRRFSVLLWVALALVGMVAAVNAIGAVWWGWGSPLDPATMAGIALVLPFVAAPLWGKQIGAAFVATIAALWILPAAFIGVLAYAAYLVLEFAANRFGATPPTSPPPP